MSKADGQYIAIKFTTPITSDPSGDAAAFTIAGQEYDMQPGGALINGDYEVESISTYDSVNVDIDLNAGTLMDLTYADGALTLAEA